MNNRKFRRQKDDRNEYVAFLEKELADCKEEVRREQQNNAALLNMSKNPNAKIIVSDQVDRVTEMYTREAVEQALAYERERIRENDQELDEFVFGVIVELRDKCTMVDGLCWGLGNAETPEIKQKLQGISEEIAHLFHRFKMEAPMYGGMPQQFNNVVISMAGERLVGIDSAINHNDNGQYLQRVASEKRASLLGLFDTTQGFRQRGRNAMISTGYIAERAATMSRQMKPIEKAQRITNEILKIDDNDRTPKQREALDRLTKFNESGKRVLDYDTARKVVYNAEYNRRNKRKNLPPSNQLEGLENPLG